MNFLAGQNTQATNFDFDARPIYKVVECKHDPKHWQLILTNSDIPFLWNNHCPISQFVSKGLAADEIKKFSSVAKEATIIFPVANF